MAQDAGAVSSYVGEIAKRLVDADHASTILLIGSYSRGDSRETSDIDVVVISRLVHSAAELTKHLPESKYKQRVSLIPFSREMFRALYRNGDLFVHHVTTEGKVVCDDGFFGSLSKETMPDFGKDARRELNVAKERLTIYRNVDAFNDYNVYPASRLFAILSQVIVAGVALRGEAVFNRGKAMKRFLQYYPETQRQILKLIELQPYAQAASRHRPSSGGQVEEISTSDLRGMVDSLEMVIQNVEHSTEN